MHFNSLDRLFNGRLKERRTEKKKQFEVSVTFFFYFLLYTKNECREKQRNKRKVLGLKLILVQAGTAKIQKQAGKKTKNMKALVVTKKRTMFGRFKSFNEKVAPMNHNLFHQLEFFVQTCSWIKRL